MNAMQVFNYEGNEVRTVIKGNEPWWVLADVCRVLDIQNNRNAARRLDDDEKGVHLMDTLGGGQKMTIINESGLYKVILRSDKPEAKKFTRWVTHEVLPAIRKTGSYSQPGAAQPFTMEQMAQFAAAVAAQVVTQIVPVIISTVKEAAQTAQPTAAGAHYQGGAGGQHGAGFWQAHGPGAGAGAGPREQNGPDHPGTPAQGAGAAEAPGGAAA